MKIKSRFLGVAAGLLASLLVFAAASSGAEAHRNGCHRWHSCPSDTGSYVCGDLGYYTYCGYGPSVTRQPVYTPPPPAVGQVVQSKYPSVSLGTTARLTLVMDISYTQPIYDNDLEMVVVEGTSSALRGWDAQGLVARNVGSKTVRGRHIFSPVVQALAPGVHRFYVEVRHRTLGTLFSGIYWDFEVAGSPSSAVTRLYEGAHSRWVGQSPYPVLARGQVGEVSVRFANTGTVAWERGRWGSQVNLAINGDSQEPFRQGIAWNWLWSDRIATTTAAVVAPGEVGEFRFTVRAPLAPGVYQLHVRPVMDGTAWLEDDGVFVLIVVR